MTLTLPERRAEVGRLVADDPTLSQRDLAGRLGVAQTTIKRDLDALRAAVLRARLTEPARTGEPNRRTLVNRPAEPARRAEPPVHEPVHEPAEPPGEPARTGSTAVRHLSAAARAASEPAADDETWRTAARATMRTIVDRLDDGLTGRDPGDLADLIELAAVYAATRGIDWRGLLRLGEERAGALGRYDERAITTPPAH